MQRTYKRVKTKIINLSETSDDELLPIQGKKVYLPTNRQDIIPSTPDIVKTLDLNNLEFPVPEGKTLFSFQKNSILEMLRFMQDLAMKGVYLGSDMGLGKTCTTITLAANILKSKRILVLCPSGLRGTWETEIRDWDLDPLPTIHTLYTSRGAIRPVTAKWCVCSYALLLKKNVFERLYEVPWDFIIFDEAKELKSMDAKRTVLAIELWNRARRGIWQDGTPITRTTLDIYPACHTLMPGDFTCIDTFAEEYCLKRSVPWGWQGWEYFGGKNLEKLRDIIRSNFFVRKKKEEVLPDLPDTTYQKIVLDCGPFDKKLTEAQENFILDAVRMGKDPNECARPEDKKHISERRLEAGMKTLKEGKEFIGNMLESKIPIVVVAYHRAVIDAIMEIYNQYNPVKIDGSVVGAAKDRARDAFNTGKTDLIVLQIKSAVGINLQYRCSTVIYVETSYDPTQIEQSRDRVRRIGQKNAINCYFLVAKGSVDEEVFEVMKRKLMMIEQVIVST